MLAEYRAGDWRTDPYRGGTGRSAAPPPARFAACTASLVGASTDHPHQWRRVAVECLARQCGICGASGDGLSRTADEPGDSPPIGASRLELPAPPIPGARP